MKRKTVAKDLTDSKKVKQTSEENCSFNVQTLLWMIRDYIPKVGHRSFLTTLDLMLLSCCCRSLRNAITDKFNIRLHHPVSRLIMEWESSTQIIPMIQVWFPTAVMKSATMNLGWAIQLGDASLVQFLCDLYYQNQEQFHRDFNHDATLKNMARRDAVRNDATISKIYAKFCKKMRILSPEKFREILKSTIKHF